MKSVIDGQIDVMISSSDLNEGISVTWRDNITSQNKPTIIDHSLIQSRRGSRVSMRIRDFWTGQVIIFDCGYNRRGHLPLILRTKQKQTV